MSRRVLLAALTGLGVLLLGLTPVPPAAADGPGVGAPWVVTLGDSYISGEAGRWAGSSNASSARADALGATAYFDNASGNGEAITRCHRSRSAQAHIGGGVQSLNLACSGATTATTTGDNFKPGLDFYDDGAGRVGQARALQQAAATRNVTMVVVSIGGNDFNFASIVQSCVVNFLYSPSWWKDYCYDDSSVTANFTAANVSAVRTRIAAALQNVRTAMRNAGYTDSSWTLLVQTYPSPIPRASGFRYAQSGYPRQSTGGCGFWDADANWANDTALPTINNTVRAAATASGLANIKVLDLAAAFNGRRLCENTVGLYEERGIANWTSPGAVDQTEWINQIRTVSTCCSNSPYYIQESLHPNYWAQLATRSCVRMAYNGGAPRSGTCSIAGTGLTGGEPRMRLQ
ncbi:SGNH/GDSL hydrolase family protein [Nocardioides sp. R-C-SC26]|uniref:SGNH/GDSL hydrolase family protein n=1 Tax=Nocardioides sp. R-C-SC26 TaxID=2870414 RepID=UPI001E3D062B|nr:SGNH/GDSL hydrolase family protein [Nocardioides sp. R-C-SC26]